MILFRHADRRYPFLWETGGQPAARWNSLGDPPTQVFSDTPDGAWAEFLRHEGISEVVDLAGIRRALWVVEAPDEPLLASELPVERLTGGLSTHAECRAEAKKLRESGARGLRVLSAALVAAGAGGSRVGGVLQPGAPRDGRTVVLFGARPDLVGWKACDEGRPAVELLERVRPLAR